MSEKREKKSSARKVVKPTNTTDIRDQSWVSSRLVRYGMVAVFMLLLLGLLPFNAFRGLPAFERGEPWRHSDLVAPFDFALQKPSDQYEAELEEIKENTPLIFVQNNNAYLQSVNKLDSTFNRLQPLIISYVNMQKSRQSGLEVEAMRDSVQYSRFMNNLDLDIGSDELQMMLRYFAQKELNRSVASGNLTTEDTQQVIYGLSEKERIRSILRDLYQNPLIDRKKSTLAEEVLTLRQPFNNREQTLSPERVLDLEEAMLRLDVGLSRDPMISELIEPALLALLPGILVPNYTYDDIATQSIFEDAKRLISTNEGAIAREQVIIRKGDIVTQETIRVLESLEKALGSTATRTDILVRYSGDALLMLLIGIGFLFYFKLYAREIIADNPKFLMVILTIGLVAILHRVISPFNTISAYLTPLAIAPILLTIFLNPRIGLVTAFFIPMIASLISGPDSQFLISSTLAGIVGTYSSRDLKDRMQFYVITPSLIFVAYLLVHLGFMVSRFTDLSNWTEPLIYFAGNALSILLIYPIVLLFERIFNMTTDFTLLELVDNNNPILNELAIKAPGTHHHSLHVSLLSEAAANAIGAHALLCRTAAMYHDIGKIKRPYYFIENQEGENEHDNIKPSMSAMIIKDHVNQGVILAKEAGLPKSIIDFIETHHGTTLIKYFYNRALESAEDKEEVKEETYRYDGPIPFTKETGIVMLADTVEAASRALKDPAYGRLETLIDKLVDAKINEGQLANTPLTFKDIQKIKEVFLPMVSAYHHNRVDYSKRPKSKAEKESADKEKVKQQEKSADKE